MYALNGFLRKGSEQRQEQEDELSKMKPKKLSERDHAVSVFKKTYTARCGFLCGTLMMCASLALLSGSCPTFFVKTRRGIAVQGKISFEEAFECNRTDIDSDVCILRGNVHIVTGNNSRIPSVFLHSHICEDIDVSGRMETVQPYPRKKEKDSTMLRIKPIPLHCVDDSQERFLSAKERDPDRQNICDKIHNVPGLIFSSGGFTYNFFHSFQDVLIPLFILTQHLKGDVVLVTSDIKPKWIERWNKVLRKLSRYPVINLDEDSGQHCFPEVVVGTYVHGNLGVEPSLMPNNETMQDFQKFLYEALATSELKRSGIAGGFSNPVTDRKLSPKEPQTGLPKLLIIERTITRILLNQEEVVQLARDLKFDVTVVSLRSDLDLQEVYDMVHRCDVVMGVHGAGLANMIFMRRNAVIIQIVPIGTDWPSTHFFGKPAATELGLQYMEYNIKPEESSLSDTYGVDHAILQDPLSYTKQGWEVEQRLYLIEQSVRPNITGLRETLLTARSAALQAFS